MPIIICLLCLVLLFLFLVFPSPKRHPDTKLLKGLYIAHRGLHDKAKGIPENSLPAFKAAVDSGFALENDIHLSKDGHVVVFHDDTALRVCGIDKKICDMTLDEIKELRLFGTSCQIPTLKECLNVVDGRVPLLIEFKHDGNAEKLCKAAKDVLKDYNGKYFLQSFYPQSLYFMRKYFKNICRGQLSCNFKGEALHKKLSSFLLYNFLSRPHFISFEHTDYKNPFFRFVIKLGATPVGWTFKSEKDLAHNSEAFDCFIFEDFTPKK